MKRLLASMMALLVCMVLKAQSDVDTRNSGERPERPEHLCACFSGAQRGNGMVVAARVVIKAKTNNPMGNTVVFTAATDKQTAYPYEEKGHGMFTYYLLKILRETKGKCTLGELGAYVSDEMAKQAVVTNDKEQTPVVLTSQGVANNWRYLKLR